MSDRPPRRAETSRRVEPRQRRFLLPAPAAAAALLLACPALADPPGPVASYIFPAGARRGSVTDVRVGGEHLAPYSRLRMEGPGIALEDELKDRPPLRYLEPEPYRAPTMNSSSYPKEWAARLTVAPDAPMGARAWRISSAQGGTSARLFVVGDLREMLESEPNSRLKRAQAVAPPVTINGQFNPREDVDLYRFDLTSGQTISCDVACQRLGSPADPVLQVLDGAGKVLAAQDDAAGRDPRLSFTAPRAGRYLLRLHDVAYGGGPESVYRLTVTTQPLVEYAFPPGGQRGRSVNIEIFTHPGTVLPGGQRPVTMSAAADARLQMFRPQSAANAVPLAVGDYPEVIEQEPNGTTPNRVTPPVTINGQLQQVNDLDTYAFAAHEGERWRLECVAQRIQSPVRAVLVVTAPDGRQLVEVSAPAGGDPRQEFTAPRDGEYRIAVRDLNGAVRGGPNFIYRLELRRAGPDFQLSLAKDTLDLLPGGSAALDLAVTRLGSFEGPIQLAAQGLPPGVLMQTTRVEPGQPQVKLTFSAAREADVADGTVRLVGTAVLPSGPLARSALAPYLGASSALPSVGPPALDTFLVTVTHPPLFSVESDDTFTYAPKGSVYPARVRVLRRPGFDSEVRLRIADRQIRDLDGFSADEVTVPPGQAEVVFPVCLPETMALSRPSSRVYVLGTSVIRGRDGRLHGLLAVSPRQIVIKSTPSLMSLTADRDVLEVSPRSAVGVRVTLHRTPQCPEQVEVFLALPVGARGVSMAPVRLGAGETTARVMLHFAPDARFPLEPQLRLRARGLRNGYAVEAFATIEVDLRR